jgi:hypothetical protein
VCRWSTKFPCKRKESYDYSFQIRSEETMANWNRQNGEEEWDYSILPMTRGRRNECHPHGGPLGLAQWSVVKTLKIWFTFHLNSDPNSGRDASIAGMSMISARNITEKIVCNCVSVHFSKYHFIDSESGDTGDWKGRRKVWHWITWSIVDWMVVWSAQQYGRCTLNSRTFCGFSRFYDFQCCLSSGRAENRKITPNCFPSDERSSQKVMWKHCWF